MEGDALRVYQLLQTTEPVSYQAPPQDEESAEALMLAAARGHSAVVEALIEIGAPINLVFPGGSALHAAVMGNYPDVVQRLIDAGAELNLTDRQWDSRRQGWSPLMYAACYGRTAIAQQLLQAGADANITDRDGQTPLMIAANAGHTAVALLLLEAGATLSARDYYGNTPLACALAHDLDASPLLASLKSPLWSSEFHRPAGDPSPSPSAAIAQRP